MTPWVDLWCHEYPENGLLAGLGWIFIYVKTAKAKNNAISYLGVPRAPMQAILGEALPLSATPKGVIQKLATKLTLIYLKAPRLKNSVITYLIVFSEYGMTNASI